MNKKLGLIQGIHHVVRVYFKARGFKWEVRRAGELKLGYWKLKLRARDPKHTYPKRLVLIPGFGDTPMSWYPVMVLMFPWLRAAGYEELVLMDFPGFRGFLAQERSFPCMDQLIQATQDTLDALKPHTIIGHSLGGWLTAHYALDCGKGARPSGNSLNYRGPERIVLANPSGAFPDEETKLTWGRIFQDAAKEGFPVIRPHLFAKEPWWFRHILAEFSSFIHRDDILQFLESVRHDHIIEDGLHHFRGQAWILWGEKDTLVPASCAPAWMKLFDDPSRAPAQAVILPQSGHSPHIEQPWVTASVLGQIVSNKKPFAWGYRWWRLVG